MMKIKKLGALLLSAVLCIGMAAPAFAYEGNTTPVEQPVLPEIVEEDTITITDEESGALTPEGNLFRWQRPAVHHARQQVGSDILLGH